MKEPSHLQLEEQVCFPIYATSRMIIRMYQPWLEPLNLTYPQYLVMLLLWEKEKLSVSALGKKLYLNSNTLTPLIKKLIDKDFVHKERSIKDERTVFLTLTKKGHQLQTEAEEIPFSIVNSMNMSTNDLKQLRSLMWKFLQSFD